MEEMQLNELAMVEGHKENEEKQEQKFEMKKLETVLTILVLEPQDASVKLQSNTIDAIDNWCKK